MAEQIRMKQGDLEPAFQVTLKYANGKPVDLSDAEEVRIRFSTITNELFERVVDILDQSDEANWGKVSYSWQSGDTAEPGTYQATWVVDWPNTRPQTFPSKSYTPVHIEEVTT